MYIILLAELTFSYPDWKLAFNIHAADGHNFGYASQEWHDDSDIGTAGNAFSRDYKSYDVTLETANFIAIVRHHNGICDAARVWEFLEVGNTLKSYLDWDTTSRLVATHAVHTFSYISPTMLNQDQDPIFNTDGALVFNWWYSDNGVRIGNRNNYCSGSGLPGEAVGGDNYWGLGNEVWGGSKARSSNYWFDSGIQNCGLPVRERVQGSDHWAGAKDGPLYGQYAIYVSDEAKTFICEGIDLKISMDSKLMAEFNRIDRGNDNSLNYDEVVFNLADGNNDKVLSAVEYSDARADFMFGETATDSSVQNDFQRVDKDHDKLLTFLEIAFDSADHNKDGRLSITEYSEARTQELLGEDGTDEEVARDFQRIDQDGDESLIFTEIAFDAADTDKDGELSAREYRNSDI